ncbi:unnamed protein product [Bursaphelenchus okinawaensis]|uniref:E3 ubiquitin-protein ligase UBR5 n=1 Tax=Bursaphelenchus okinawaensis TaxID=465554 RepID=A0A811LN50_9BILA|nr:unnamed protein product [Bursaphelenchus okinawaensis]CAG9125928.1 unnamed protein product [Bursaphelenchus okinawaensis]
MSDHKQLFLFGRAFPSKVDDNAFIERLIDSANSRNKYGAAPTSAIASIPANEIVEMIVGPSSIGFLFKNHRIARLDFDITSNPVSNESAESTSFNNQGATDPGSSVSAASAATGSSSTAISGSGSSGIGFGSSASASRNAKLRRMMIAARRPGAILNRTGVIVDRSRAMLPASSIPEELIAQAQVVLQGKSRELIVRELQRTNLNVNEAVNNLLSRDDDEDEMDDQNDSYLHEELLSLLDAGLRGDGAAAVIDGEGLYSGAEYEYMLRDSRRRDEAKAKERKGEAQQGSELTQQNFKFADELYYWHDVNGDDFPAGVTKFLQIGSSYTGLFALGDNGKLYQWRWKDRLPVNEPHEINFKILNSNERIVNFAASSWRIAYLTNNRRVGTFMDDYCGPHVSDGFNTAPIELPEKVVVEKLMVCSLYAAIQTANKLYWWGIHPFTDRVLMFENAKRKTREEPLTKPKEITVGSEVRTRAIPIYAASSVGVSFVNGVIMVGVLMEAAWTMNETCRFRVMTPDQYEIYVKNVPESENTNVNHDNLSETGGGAQVTAQYRETAWNLKDVTFIYEEPVCDTAIVKIVDGSYAGIVYKSAIEQSEKENNGVANEVELLRSHLRLMRKDELVLVPSLRLSRSPQTFQKKLVEVKLPKNVRKVISSAVDNNCFRLLVEKTDGEAALVQTNGYATDICSQYMPIDINVLNQARDKTAKAWLDNHGDENALVLCDANGSLLPVIPDSTNGIKDPVYLAFGAAKHVGVGIRYLNNGEVTNTIITSHQLCNEALAKNNDAPKTVQKMALYALLISPETRTTEPKIDSLIQNIQYCSLNSVKRILKELEEASEDERKYQLLNAHTNGNRNIFHTAIMNAFSTNNKDQADDFKQIRFENGHIVLIENAPSSKKSAEKLDTTEAEAHGQKFDQRWKDMIGAASDSAKGVLKSKSSEQAMEISERSADRPVSARQRQKNAIMILGELVSSPIMASYFDELMKQKDIHGHTPFYSAVHLRAYSAAVILWHKVRDLKLHETDSLTKICMNNTGVDSPLFILCYNDTCSFTWTGEEHINQDIFECKTCDLVGSLCCCTECAYTCHRDHDCKLKRTSPTAYCDCWEKCGCKALVSGNVDQREELLKLLLKETNLINLLSSKGEHLTLFLARALGRQTVEQENFPRRAKLRAATQNTNENIPEHDLDPPKFSGVALNLLLTKWESVKSVLQVGIKYRTGETPISEDLFQLNEQDGVNHLDRFVFTLIARCPESHLDTLLNTLISQANKKSGRDPEVNRIIARFTRSVVRLFVFLCISSPMATGSSLNVIAATLGSMVELRKRGSSDPKLNIATSLPSSTSAVSKSLMPNYRAITVSGVLSLVRTSLPFSSNGGAKESKKKAINGFVLKCHRVFQVLLSHSITELVNVADALIAPVRLGVARQTIPIHKSVGPNDVLDMIERYLNSETDLTSLLTGVTSSPKRKRIRRISMHRDARGSDNSDSDDSDSDDNPGPNNNYSAAAVETARRTVDNVMRETVGAQALDYSFNVHDGYSSSNNSDDDDENEDEDDFDGEDEEVAEISNARREVDEMNDDEQRPEDDPSMDEEEGEDEEEEEERFVEGEDAEFYRMEDEIVDESGEEYSDEDHYDYSSEGEHSIFQEPYDEVVDIDGSSAGEVNQANAAIRRERRKAARRAARRGRNETANSEGNAAGAQRAAESMDIIAEGSHDEEVNVEPVVESQSSNAVSNAQPDSQSTATEPSDNGALVSFRPIYNADSSSRRLTGRQLFTTQSPSVGWAVRRVRQQNVDSSATPSTTVPDTSSAATHDRTATNTDNNNATESSTLATPRAAPKKSPAATTSDVDIYQTKLQLSACFALVVKVIDELMLRLLEYKQYQKQSFSGINGFLDLNSDVLFSQLKDLVNDRLELTWTWFQKIMDRIEAMLRFGNALLKSPAYADISFDSSSSKSSKKEKKKEAVSSPVSNKRDFYNYFMALMRSHSSENGDEMPVIESTPFRHVSLIAEGYLYHVNISELFHDNLSEIEDELQPSTMERARGLRKFYKRSESISYPSLTTADPHNAFKYPVGECVPLAVRSSLLKPESDKADMFLIPVPERTVDEHLRIAREHGLENPTYQSLAAPPLVHPIDDAKEEPMQVDEETNEKDPEKELYEEILSLKMNPARMQLQKTLGRWGNAMIYLAKAFKEDIVEYSGQDSFNSLLLNELGGFTMKHSQFKARIDKYRASLSSSKDLSFMNMTREKHALISDVFTHLNHQYNRRLPSNGQEPTKPVLGVGRVKATFREEPGEGSGVVRSFYSALADALVEMDYLPKEGEGVMESGTSSSNLGSTPSIKTSYTGFCTLKAPGQLEYTAKRKNGAGLGHSSGGLAAAAGLSSSDRGVRTRAQQRAASQLPPMGGSAGSKRSYSDYQKFLFNLDTAPYNPRGMNVESPARVSEPPPSSGINIAEAPIHSSSAGNLGSGSSRSQRQSETNSMLLGERFYERILSINADYSKRIAGLIVNGLPLVEQLTLIANDELLTHLVLTLTEYFAKADGVDGNEKSTADAQRLESLPLFMKISSELLTPIPGNNSHTRLNAFRNVGRMIGLCLLQLEIFPLKLCRHVMKYILGRPITWYDLAFFDPVMFDSLRSIAYNEAENRPHDDAFYESLGLTFVVDLPPEEGGGVIELLPNGESQSVTKDNVLEYIYLFVEKRLLGEHIACLDSIKQGVFDVIPPTALQGLTAEDVRLILCGSEQISIKLLESFTTFMDESSSKPESVNKIKRWFYSVISKFSDEEKQDLLFFWTGSPSLPSAEEAFTPLPTVMIRPHDDHHLPTANTCISRLYLPFYSSKKILRAKLLVAIQTRDFGFV